MTIDQFVPSGASPASLSLDDTVFYYEPVRCNGNCTVHVALAGCQMTFSDIGMDFVTGAGYNGWAEANDIVMYDCGECKLTYLASTLSLSRAFSCLATLKDVGTGGVTLMPITLLRPVLKLKLSITSLNTSPKSTKNLVAGR